MWRDADPATLILGGVRTDRYRPPETYNPHLAPDVQKSKRDDRRLSYTSKNAVEEAETESTKHMCTSFSCRCGLTVMLLISESIVSLFEGSGERWLKPVCEELPQGTQLPIDMNPMNNAKGLSFEKDVWALGAIGCFLLYDPGKSDKDEHRA